MRNVPLHLLCHRWSQTTRMDFVLAVWCAQPGVHHRMVILAMGSEASGINRWLPLVFHVAPLYTWPSILLAKTNTFLRARRGRTCFHKSQVRRVARKTRCGFQERQILPVRWQEAIKSWQMSLEQKPKYCLVTAFKLKITTVSMSWDF